MTSFQRPDETPDTPTNPGVDPGVDPGIDPGRTSVDQMAEGARQVAAGAKAYVTHTVAPATQRMGASLRQAAQRVGEQGAASVSTAHAHSGAAGSAEAAATTNLSRMIAWAPLALPAATLAAIFSLFLPLGSVSGYGMTASANFFDEEGDGVGVLLLISLLIALALAVWAVIKRNRRLTVATGVVAIVVGLFVAIDGYGTMISLSGSSGVSVGAGAVFLSLTSTVILVAAVLTLLRGPRVAPLSLGAQTVQPAPTVRSAQARG